MKKILVTGGAGFIGSFLADALIAKGYEVRILDSLDEQVHQGRIPEYLNANAEFIRGNVLERDTVLDAVEGVDAVFHLAAAVGVGQSMYQVKHYVNTNDVGTATILDVLVNGEHDVRKMIVAASMSSYGEGSYRCGKCEMVYPPLRAEEQMKKGRWELFCPECKSPIVPEPTKENKPLHANSVYAATKKNQEELVMMIGRTYGIAAVSLRFFNAYGPRQSLSNPYTGVAAMFMSRIKAGNWPVIFEDGLQTRDFISVHDIVSANVAALESQAANFEIFNVGSGRALTIKSVAETLAKIYNADISPQITNSFRKGDVRHCYADISKIKNKLGWEPKVSFEQGMRELAVWSKGVDAVDNFEQARKELKDKGLI